VAMLPRLDLYTGRATSCQPSGSGRDTGATRTDT
jgi:hypothetical protein